MKDLINKYLDMWVTEMHLMLPLHIVLAVLMVIAAIAHFSG